MWDNIREKVISITHNYINLTNGVEAIPMLKFWNEDYRFIRIQSTICEQKNWDRLIQDLDYDFLMNLALGHKCVVYDFGARKPVPRAVYQGLEFVKYVLSRRWLDQEYITNVNRSKNQEKKNNCNDYFYRCYQRLEDRTKKKLDYFLPYVIAKEINLECVTDCTQHDNDKEFYREILRKAG